MSGSVCIADTHRPRTKADVAEGFVRIPNQRIGYAVCQEVWKQPKTRINAIILLIDQTNVEPGCIALANGHERLFGVALQAKRAHQIIASPVGNDTEWDMRQHPMARQH